MKSKANTTRRPDKNANSIWNCILVGLISGFSINMFFFSTKKSIAFYYRLDGLNMSKGEYSSVDFSRERWYNKLINGINDIFCTTSTVWKHTLLLTHLIHSTLPKWNRFWSGYSDFLIIGKQILSNFTKVETCVFHDLNMPKGEYVAVVYWAHFCATDKR